MPAWQSAVASRMAVSWRPALPSRPFIEQIVPWLYFTFGIAVISGIALFFYDPVHVGSHAYFAPKLILTALGVINAALFRRSGHLAALTADTPASERAVAHARMFGALSLAIWIGVVVCACLNVEAAPRVLLR